MPPGLLLAALLSLPPQSTAPACAICDAPKSLGPATGDLHSQGMKNLVLGGAIGIASGWNLAGTTQAPARSPGAIWHGKKPLIIWGAVGAVALTRFITHDGEPPPVTDRSARPSSPSFIDAGVRRGTGGQLSPKARLWAARASYWTLGALMGQSIGIAASGTSRLNPYQDWSIPWEAGVAAGLLTETSQHLFHRTRPFAYFCEPLNRKEANEKNARLSFFSGHTSIAFALAASTSHVASVRQWENARTIRRLNYTLASATGLLRILGDRHYLTDVLVGAVVGWTTGHFLAKWRAQAERSAQTPVDNAAPMASCSFPAGGNRVVTAQFGKGFGFNVVMVR